MIVIFALAIAMFLSCGSVSEATTYYLSPTGSNSNDGLSTGTPKLTFAHVIPLLFAGDTLYLTNGTYTTANSGMLVADCNTTAHDGTVSAHVTIQALNERQAHIGQNGDQNANIRISNCSYWDFVGLYLSSNEYTGSTSLGATAHMVDCDHITWKYNLFYRNNNYANVHLISWVRSPHVWVIENEFYAYHRHAIVPGGATSFGSDFAVIRGNYINSRYRNSSASGGHGNGNGSRGDSCVEGYPLNKSIIENNICENSSSGFTTQAIGEARDNKWLGNIFYEPCTVGVGQCSISIGLRPQMRGEPFAQNPLNNIIKDFVSINAFYFGLGLDSNQNAQISQTSIFLPSVMSTASKVGARCVLVSSGSNLSCFYTNTVVVGPGPAGAIGFLWTSQSNWGANYTNAVGIATNYSPDDGHVTNKNTSTPTFGSCYLWVPAGSPLKGAGLGGADIGATILYKYIDGVLTNEPVWNTSTGVFYGCRTVVAGVNDSAGDSCNNVHERLHVNTGGCSFPAGYGTVQDPSPPGTLTQSKFRFEAFNDPEASPHLLPDLGANPSTYTNANLPIYPGGKARLRIKIAANNELASGNRGVPLWCSHNGGTYAAVGNSYGALKLRFAGLGSDTVIGVTTSEQMPSDQAGAVQGQIVRTADPVPQAVLTASSDVEIVYMLQTDPTAAIGDTWDCRVRQMDGAQTVTVLDTYTATPRLTAVGLASSGQ